MKLEQTFEVAAPLERVWQALIDVEKVAPCLPGAAVTGRNDDGSYNGTFTIKIGPTTAAYAGKLEMENVDEVAHTATMQAQGTDKRGQGGAKATIKSKLTPGGNGTTRVEVDTDYHITGRLARFGRGGMIEDISQRLLNEFANRLQSSLEQAGPEPAAAPASEVSGGAAPEPSADAEPAPDAEEQPTGEADAVSATEAPVPLTAAAGAPAPQAGIATATDQAPAEVHADPEPVAPPPPPPPGPAAGTPPPPPPGAAAPPPGPEATEPIHGLSLVGSVLLQRLKRNPAPFIGFAVVVLVLRAILRRRD